VCHTGTFVKYNPDTLVLYNTHLYSLLGPALIRRRDDCVYWILCSVELLGWLVSPEVSAWTAFYSKYVPVLHSTSVFILYRQVCPYCTVHFSVLYSTNVPVQCSVSVLYSNSVSVLYATNVLVL